MTTILRFSWFGILTVIILFYNFFEFSNGVWWYSYIFFFYVFYLIVPFCFFFLPNFILNINFLRTSKYFMPVLNKFKWILLVCVCCFSFSFICWLSIGIFYYYLNDFFFKFLICLMFIFYLFLLIIYSIFVFFFFNSYKIIIIGSPSLGFLLYFFYIILIIFNSSLVGIFNILLFYTHFINFLCFLTVFFVFLLVCSCLFLSGFFFLFIIRPLWYYVSKKYQFKKCLKKILYILSFIFLLFIMFMSLNNFEYVMVVFIILPRVLEVYYGFRNNIKRKIKTIYVCSTYLKLPSFYSFSFFKTTHCIVLILITCIFFDILSFSCLCFYFKTVYFIYYDVKYFFISSLLILSCLMFVYFFYNFDVIDLLWLIRFGYFLIFIFLIFICFKVLICIESVSLIYSVCNLACFYYSTIMDYTGCVITYCLISFFYLICRNKIYRFCLLFSWLENKYSKFVTYQFFPNCLYSGRVINKKTPFIRARKFYIGYLPLVYFKDFFFNITNSIINYFLKFKCFYDLFFFFIYLIFNFYYFFRSVTHSIKRKWYFFFDYSLYGLIFVYFFFDNVCIKVFFTFFIFFLFRLLFPKIFFIDYGFNRIMFYGRPKNYFSFTKYFKRELRIFRRAPKVAYKRFTSYFHFFKIQTFCKFLYFFFFFLIKKIKNLFVLLKLNFIYDFFVNIYILYNWIFTYPILEYTLLVTETIEYYKLVKKFDFYMFYYADFLRRKVFRRDVALRKHHSIREKHFNIRSRHLRYWQINRLRHLIKYEKDKHFTMNDSELFLVKNSIVVKEKSLEYMALCGRKYIKQILCLLGLVVDSRKKRNKKTHACLSKKKFTCFLSGVPKVSFIKNKSTNTYVIFLNRLKFFTYQSRFEITNSNKFLKTSKKPYLIRRRVSPIRSDVEKDYPSIFRRRPTY